MEIAFRTKALRVACLDRDTLDRRYGPERAEYLRARIADMRAADLLGDVPLIEIEPSITDGTFGSEVFVTCGNGLKLTLKVNHANPPKLSDGRVDWSRLERVLVQQIEYDSV